jgi:YaaC-like Protein
MPKLPVPRDGKALQIGTQPVRFSRWPVRKKGHSHVPQTELLTKNPWEVMEGAINLELDRRSKPADVCLAFLYQALDFYRAYEDSRVSSKPLLLYYSLLNVVKALIACRDPTRDLGNAIHGLSENRASYTKALITASADNNRYRAVYDLFSQKLGEGALVTDHDFNLSKTLLPQIVIGHRLWAQAANKRERFVRVQRFQYLHSEVDRSVWVTFEIQKSDLEIVGVTGSQFVRNAQMTGFRQVRAVEDGTTRTDLLRFEQVNPQVYQTKPAEALHQLSAMSSKHVWCIMRTVPPYRRYYLWAGEPPADLLNPVLSVYLVLFYLGSVTRYRPYYFEELQGSAFGNLFDEIVQTQGQQMLYHLAAEFAQRDVSWPAVL